MGAYFSIDWIGVYQFSNLWYDTNRESFALNEQRGRRVDFEIIDRWSNAIK